MVVGLIFNMKTIGGKEIEKLIEKKQKLQKHILWIRIRFWVIVTIIGFGVGLICILN